MDALVGLVGELTYYEYCIQNDSFKEGNLRIWSNFSGHKLSKLPMKELIMQKGLFPYMQQAENLKESPVMLIIWAGCILILYATGNTLDSRDLTKD